MEVQNISAQIPRNVLLNPGPATTSERVKRAQLVSDICPREKSFCEVMAQSARGLLQVVQVTEQSHACVFFAGSGTAAMDATISSVVPHGKKIAILVNGAYGDRMVAIAKTYGIPAVVIGTKETTRLSMEAFETALKSDADIAVAAMIHHETTTGILNPLSDFAALCKKYNKISVVDAISSFAGIPIHLGQLDVDYMMSTSNKCIQGMAGLAFVFAKRSSLKSLEKISPRSYYLGLYRQHLYQEQTGQMAFTPPVQCFYALLEAIRELQEEGGVAARYARYTNNWQVLREGIARLGFEFLLEAHEESRILFTIFEPKGKNFSFDAFHDAMLEKGFTIYPGKLGSLPTFRLANMGDLYPQDMKNFIKAAEEFLIPREKNLQP